MPTATIDRAIAYVQKSRVRQGPDRGLFYYKIYGRGAFDKPREYAINAAALTALSSAGIHEAELSDPVLDFLAEYARVHRRDGEHYYYWYGNYYAAQAFYQHGGRRLGRSTTAGPGPVGGAGCGRPVEQYDGPRR